MAIWDNPRRRVKQMEQELDELRRQQEQMRQQIQQQGAQRIQQLEREYQARFNRLAQETDAAYARRLQQMQEQILRENNEQLQELQAFDKRCREEREAQLAQLREANEALQKQLKDIQDRSDRQETVLRGEAESMISQAKQTNSQAQQTSHQFFFPDQLSVIESQMSKSVSMLNRGLYSVAAASALSAITEMELLILNVRQKEEEWLQLFNSYAAIITRISAQLEAFRDEQHETIWTRMEEKPGHLLTDSMRNYWSSRQYDPLCRQIGDASAQIRHAQEIGVREFLREGGALRAGQLVNAIRDARILEDRLTAVITSIRNELRFSDERYVAGCLLADALYDLDYQISQEGFLRNAEGVEQPLDSYEIRAELGDNVRLQITISPVRENGVVTHNMIFVSVELPRLQDPQAIAELIRSWQGRISSILQQSGMSTEHLIVRRSGGLELPALISDLASRRPDPGQYAQKLALKY